MAHTLISMPVWNCLFLMSHTPWIGVAIALFCKNTAAAGLMSTSCEECVVSLVAAASLGGGPRGVVGNGYCRVLPNERNAAHSRSSEFSWLVCRFWTLKALGDLPCLRTEWKVLVGRGRSLPSSRPSPSLQILGHKGRC